jgi:hypothetical protein
MIMNAIPLLVLTCALTACAASTASETSTLNGKPVPACTDSHGVESPREAPPGYNGCTNGPTTTYGTIVIECDYVPDNCMHPNNAEGSQTLWCCE